MIVVVDYGMGNLGSIAKALEYVGGEVLVTNDPARVAQADKLVLPGMGAFQDGMKHLEERGLVPLLTDLVLNQKKPFLGICLGMQLLAKRGFEWGEYPGLGWIDAEVVRFEVDKIKGLSVPHVGWNDLTLTRSTPLFAGLENGADVYFVHSYHLACREPKLVTATFEYGDTFTAALMQENIFATQFHPEKSQRDGLTMLKNFLSWQPQ